MIKIKLENIIKNFRDNLYLIIPMICVMLWAIFYIVHQFLVYNSFYVIQPDFKIIYTLGKVIINNPQDFYKQEYNSYYLPIFPMVLSVTVSLLPYYEAQYTFFTVNIILGFIFTREYNRILILKDLKKKSHRFLFLMIISNGYVVYWLFWHNQFKYIIGVILLFVIRREIQYRIESKEKDFKFYLINYFLFAFCIAVFPPFILFLLIYIFQDISIHDLFKKSNIKKYIIIILMLTAQNFILLIYPSLIFDSLSRYESHNINWMRDFPLFYIYEWKFLMDNNLSMIITILLIILFIITLLFVFNKKLKIEEKYSYYSIIWLYISPYALRTLLILFPLAILLFIPFLNQNVKKLDFIKKNLIVLIGLLSVSIIYFMFPDYTIFKYFPQLNEGIFKIIVYFRYIFLMCIFGFDLLISNLKNYHKN